jgi:CubicO group peptidase (beta-lactamase class C family)
MTPLLFDPGERWEYGSNIDWCGQVIEAVAGKRLGEVFQSRIFEPLGMRDTAFYARDTSRLATAYTPTPEGLQVVDPPDGQWSHPSAFGDGAAGLVSTADDLLAFARMLLRGGSPVLSRDSVAAMTGDQLTPEQRRGIGFLDADRSWSFCQSVVVDGPRAGAFGWDGGFGTTWLVDPQRELVVIVMSQRQFETPQAPQVHRDVQDAAYAAVAGA